MQWELRGEAMMAEAAVEVRVTVDPGHGSDVDELASATRQVRERLQHLDAVTSVDLVRAASAGEGRKAGDLVQWGQLIIALGGAGGALTVLVGALQSWLSRDERRTITLEVGGDKIVLTGLSESEQGRLIDAWLRRHGAGR
jgi:hypothetical protein